MIKSSIVAHAVQHGLKPLPGVRNLVAVASGKGGVGKSTVAVNLALALAAEGARVGVLDADIYGPSQPLMLGLSGGGPTRPTASRSSRCGRTASRRCRSASWSTRSSRWSGAGRWSTQALTQLLDETRWGELDYLIVDMPPGTGDIQLTLAQRVPVSGRGHRHHAAGHRAARRAQGRCRCSRRSPCRCSASSRT